MTLLAIQQAQQQQQPNLQALQSQLGGLNPQQLRMLQAQVQQQQQQQQQQQPQNLQQNQHSSPSPSPSTLRASPAMAQLNLTPQQLFLQQKAAQQLAQQQPQQSQPQRQYQNKVQQFQQFQQQQQQQQQRAAAPNATMSTSPSFTPASRPGSSGYSMPQTSGPQNTSGTATSGTKPGNSPDQFMRTLLEFMQKRGTPITSHPFVAGRVVPLPLLYAVVMKCGGSAKLNAAGMSAPTQPLQKNWYTAAAALGFNLNEIPDAPQQLAQAFQRYLHPFEEWWLNSPQHQQQLRLLQAHQQQQQQQQQNAMLLQQPQPQHQPVQQQPQDMSQNIMMQTGMMSQAPTASSMSMSPQQLQQQLQSPLLQHQSPMLQAHRMSPAAPGPGPAAPASSIYGGVKPTMPMGSPPPTPGAQSPASVRQPLPRNRSKSRPKSTHPALRNLNPPPPTTPQVQAPIPAVAPQTVIPQQTLPVAQASSPSSPPQPKVQVQAQTPQPPQPAELPAAPSQEVVSYVPKTRRLDLHGGFNISILAGLGDEIEAVRGDFPLLQEMGEINLHAVIMSLRSLIPGELKVALDSLLLISVEQHIVIPIAECEDLVDALIDVGEDCVKQIAQVKIEPKHNSADAADAVEFDPYETMVAAARDEFEGFVTPLKPGSDGSTVRKLTDRLSAVTTILRNLSFYEHNQPFLAVYQTAYRFVMDIVKRLGNDGLLTSRLTAVARLALVKDMIVILSNIAHDVRLRSSDDAKWMIALLSAFAPVNPVATATEADNGRPPKLSKLWAPYVPFKHRYLALAVDVLGKLLARESPNLVYIRAELIPATPATAETAARKLKKVLQLCMCTFPRLTDSQLLPRAFEVRRPVLEQSMFAAEILAKAVVASDIPTTCNGPMQDILRETIQALDECVKPFLTRAATVLQGFVSAPPPPLHGRQGSTAAAAASAVAAAALQSSSGDTNPFARVVRKATSVLGLLRAAASGEAAAKTADVMLEVLVLRM
ncbi:hypothetical protein V1525DRAFT_345145 [Lipomyces kononenkoae]|uniref:Uncharacterized protein n=1 Tax=Lipomyces kononenkoae TaxID=34357 RepID=A0ACC3SZ43_LIPKO